MKDLLIKNQTQNLEGEFSIKFCLLWILFSSEKEIKDEIKDDNKSKTKGKLFNSDKKIKPPKAEEGTHGVNDRPILEIDVNLKHGVKKKVIVYEGDTANDLAENFAEQNGLGEKMKNKLVILIQNEMDKLLNKITEEENESTMKSNV